MRRYEIEEEEKRKEEKRREEKRREEKRGKEKKSSSLLSLNCTLNHFSFFNTKWQFVLLLLNFKLEL